MDFNLHATRDRLDLIEQFERTVEEREDEAALQPGLFDVADEVETEDDGLDWIEA